MWTLFNQIDVGHGNLKDLSLPVTVRQNAFRTLRITLMYPYVSAVWKINSFT